MDLHTVYDDHIHMAIQSHQAQSSGNNAAAYLHEHNKSFHSINGWRYFAFTCLPGVRDTAGSNVAKIDNGRAGYAIESVP